MNIYDLIYRKRNGEAHRPEEIAAFVAKVAAGEVAPEQTAAWLMAAFLKGLSAAEMTALTRAMTDSGEKLDLSGVPGAKVDKHSTGGVGDGTSLVLAPLLAAAGAVVPMMSGRALGHTGGTLDKLEAIPGFRVDLSPEEFKDKLRSVGCAMIGQTAKVAPADKKLYAVRDVTATIDSVPLIAASIMSKKLAEGTSALVLDVKTGSGAFMQKTADARALARAMVKIGNGAGVKTMALITDMDQPLGRVAGNALEVRQAWEVLSGGGPADFVELVLELGGWMMVLAGRAKTAAAARPGLQALLKDGRARGKFLDMVRAQGGDAAAVEHDRLPKARFTRDVASPRKGVVQRMDTRRLGMVVAALGAGRARPQDAVDHAVGLVFHKKPGDAVRAGEALATVHFNDEARWPAAERDTLESITIGAGRAKKAKLVLEIVRS